MAMNTPRPVRDEDAQDLFGLLALCFAEYPGCFVDPHDDLADLLRPATSYGITGAAFLAVEDEVGRVCACVAIDEPEPGIAELHRLYVRPDRRRTGLGTRLVAAVEALAAPGIGLIRLWSDSRFRDAHTLYTRLGYREIGRTRELGDISNSVEHLFEKEATSVRRPSP